MDESLQAIRDDLIGIVQEEMMELGRVDRLEDGTLVRLFINDLARRVIDKLIAEVLPQIAAFGRQCAAAGAQQERMAVIRYIGLIWRTYTSPDDARLLEMIQDWLYERNSAATPPAADRGEDAAAEQAL